MSDICKEALRVYGAGAQMAKLYEELGECAEALYLYEKGDDTFDHVVEECVDVEIMIEQMKIMNPNEKWGYWREFKMRRLKERLEEVKKNE